MLTGSDDGNFESITADLMNELYGSGVSLHAHLRDDPIHHVVLAIPESVHGFDVPRVIKLSLGELDTA